MGHVSTKFEQPDEIQRNDKIRRWREQQVRAGSVVFLAGCFG